MHTDPIADLLTRIRNAAKAHHQVLSVPHSTIKENILKIMQETGFISNYKAEGEGINKALLIDLKENAEELTLTRISKPGQRIYIKSQDLRHIKSGLGISIISTSKGLMTNVEARKQKLGGELICEIY
ncbi:30S ribosomal protein S8 [Candidatus Peregrinibacteria bacterium]|nr:30S ribosomal protein S8 [Candidatus Peregrinibacteria bacterium]